MLIRRVFLVLVVAVASAAAGGHPSAQAPLAPTAHPRVPPNEAEVWLVPPAAERGGRAAPAVRALASAATSYRAGDHAAAIRALPRRAADPALADYADYYRGLALLRLNSLEEAGKTFRELVERRPQGAMLALATLGQGEVAEAAGNHAAAADIYARLAGEKHLVTQEVLSRLGRAALAAGDRKTAAGAYVRLYYEFPLTVEATAAAARLSSLQDHVVRRGYEADMGRAAMLYGARRYADARSAFLEVRKLASGDDGDLAALRVAQSDFHLKRYRAARAGLRPFLERGSRRDEARFFYLATVRELGGHDEFVTRVRALVKEFPESPWAADALDLLGTHYIVTDRDEEAARTFGELFDKYPTSTRAERAAWKFGWWSYRAGEYATAVRVFETAAAHFPRSDYRPSYLYWAARAHGTLGATAQAEARYRLVQSDYGSSYYGRLAEKRLRAASTVAPALTATQRPAEPRRVPTEGRIRLLLSAGLYDDAIAELQYAQRQWGTSPPLEATIAWAYHQKGELRRAITLMRRAYPQHLTAGGGGLPVEVRQVIFPVVYWDLIRKHAAARDLDPYLVAALIAQESTFEPTARSVADARGLMQLLPSTGRIMARSAGMRPFSVRMLNAPETNIRLGTLFFSRLVGRFGGTHFALASYNAGQNRVVRWKAERPGLEIDEFIDDIPFPETQNYVKRILGTVEDYRVLYGRDGGRPLNPSAFAR